MAEQDEKIEVATEDIMTFQRLHQTSQEARLTFSDACADAIQQLAPYLLKMGEANKAFKEGLRSVAEKYQVPQDDPSGVWELHPSGNFIRRERQESPPDPTSVESP